MKTILKIDASARKNGSISRELSERLTNHLATQEIETEVIDRDLSEGVSLLTEAHIGAFYTPADKRSQEQRDLLNESDLLVSELQKADTIVLATPMYNFGVPASLKAYFDLVARVGLTFKYSEKGPKGLLEGKKAYVIIATGGTALESAIDYTSGHIKTFLGFVGISDVEFIPADQMMFKAEEQLTKAHKLIAEATL